MQQKNASYHENMKTRIPSKYSTSLVSTLININSNNFMPDLATGWNHVLFAFKKL